MQERAPPLDHQKELARLLVTHPIFAVTAEMGTAKSRPLLRAWLYLDAKSIAAGQGHIDLAIIAPKGCYLNWLTFPAPEGLEAELGELEKWLTPEEYEETVKAYWGPTSKRHLRDLAALAVAKRRRFLTVNVEALNAPSRARELMIEFCRGRRVILCVDESTCIMHHDSARTRWINNVLRGWAMRRVIMSGLIAPETPLNLFSQFFFLDPSILGWNYYGFQKRYAHMVPMNFTPAAKRTKEKPGRVTQVVVGMRSGAVAELNARIAPYHYRVLLDDIADLPQSYAYRDVELTEEQHAAYAAMKELATATLAGAEVVTASMVAHQLALLHHIVCGHARTEEGQVTDIPTHRVEAILDLLADHAGKAIIFAPYPRFLEKISAALREAYGEASTVEYWGATSLNDRVQARSRIQNDEATRFIVSNQSVGGKGGTWTAANLVIYAANSWDQEDRQQSEYRARRLGQTRTVHFVDMRARGTIEERLILVLKQKREIARELMGDRWRLWLS
jgi:hypothetical protein